jgi:hypothetical protein
MSWRSEFTIRSDRRIWPRRLLHVASMTSHERQDGNIYGSSKEPDYNVLSYTWGRWQTTHEAALEIDNVTWQIPAVQSTIFTVEQFQHTIRMAAEGVEYVWVDIACIDQENRDVKMDEIGNQAGIFENANDAYIWLHSHEYAVLQSASLQLMQCSNRLDGDNVTIRNVGGHDIPIHWADTDSDDEDIYLAPCLADPAWSSTVVQSLRIIMRDLWFSSLWTLQEAHIAGLAWIVCQNGRKINREGEQQQTLWSLFNDLGQIDRRIELYLRREDAVGNMDPHLNSLRDLRKLIARSGIHASESPVLLYSSASYRECKVELDRIYGIMQVYDLRLGESRDPSRRYDLADLELELASELNRKSPIWAQLFRHLTESRPAQSWMITYACELPEVLNFSHFSPISQCRIETQAGETRFIGKACSLTHINRQWARAAADTHGPTFWGHNKSVQIVVLDQAEFVLQRIPEHLQAPQDEASSNHNIVVDLLLGLSDESIRVFVLGKLIQPDETDSELDEEETLSRGISDPESATIGMLVHECRQSHRHFHRRFGIVVWRHLRKEQDDSIFYDTEATLQ